MNGKDLISFIENNPELKNSDISYTIKELLRRNVINPSALIDAQKKLLEEEVHRYKSHFIDAAVSSIQLLNGHWKNDDLVEAKKRFQYNTSFCKDFPNDTSLLSEEDKKRFSDMFALNYGFRPENYK